MQIKLLKDVVSLVVGQNSADIVDLLYNKKNVNEFNIAKRMEITINQTRNILYRLADHGLVSFIRKKDKKDGGWYTYFWTLDISKSLIALRNIILNSMTNLESQLKSKRTKRFYHCPICDIEYSEEKSLLNEFTCTECGGVLELKDNKEAIEHLEKEIEKLNHELKMVNDEIEAISRKIDAAKMREAKARERQVKKEREKKRKERAKLKEKDRKKALKKTIGRKSKKTGIRKKTERKQGKQKRKVKKSGSKSKPGRKKAGRIAKRKPKTAKKTGRKVGGATRHGKVKKVIARTRKSTRRKSNRGRR